MSGRRREVTALHEAAHAVVALLHPNARNPVLVELLADDRGRTTLDPSVDITKLSEEEVLAEFIVACAGNWAEHLFAPDEADFLTFVNGDVQLAAELARAVGLTEAKLAEVIERADKQHAEGWVRENERAIRKVSGLLLEKGCLTTEEIEKALQDD
jgi:ATP-dependent Zn protease